ncbi:MAG: DoxX family protein [Propionibacteriaceae bacterium]|nr:DoxX family protein [Propionibacteriaceae bacterium]
MKFLRFIFRSLLASYFIADGLQALTSPERFVDDAQPLVSAVRSRGDKVLPPGIHRKLPTSTQGFVRLHGIVQILGAFMMATGFFRRLGAMILAASYAPKVSVVAQEKTPGIALFRECALLGGVLIEAADSQGKPRRAWVRDVHKQAAQQQRADKRKDQARQRAFHKQQDKFTSRRMHRLSEILSSPETH